MTNEKVYAMPFAKIYPLLVAKAQKKGRTQEEVNEIISWLTGYSEEEIDAAVGCSSSASDSCFNASLAPASDGLTYGDFFRNAPCLNPNRLLITGTICGVRVETIEEPLMREIRYLDKLIDELAKGKSMDKILRKEKTSHA